MHVIQSGEFSNEDESKYLVSRMQTRGILRKTHLEELERVQTFLRPLMIVSFLDDDEQLISKSLLDASFVQCTQDLDLQLLLWRPKYLSLEIKDADFPIIPKIVSEDTSYHATGYLNSLLSKWNEAQQLMDDMSDDVRKIQLDRRSLVAFILPRTPSNVRKEDEIYGIHSKLNGYLLAYSLVLNCTKESTIARYKITSNIYLKTTIAKYRHIETNEINYRVLEHAGCKSIRDAEKNGAVLQRLLTLQPNCYSVFS